ncbi:hypothetical protein NEMIN01_2453 [Nematocida minor]|uniref:uncharacterized protein n=1 Tax=Nematocida minor TaxID=1912983 RepID=UPI0022207783|nr:uncharacterized protein NEMIN01_2453 [Nematocida minor]KAI5193292.1 hypothetical protein NEMIN01_2453 [Nematocida minor]
MNKEHSENTAEKDNQTVHTLTQVNKNISIHPAKGSRKPEINKSPNYLQTNSLIDFYIRRGGVPPWNHHIVNSLYALSVNKVDGPYNKSVEVMSRSAMRIMKEEKITFAKKQIEITQFTENSGNQMVSIQCDVLTEITSPYVRQWRTKISDIIQIYNLTKDLRKLIRFLVPEEVHPSLEKHHATDALLDQVCFFYEKTTRLRIGIVPKQKDYIFLQCYYEAITVYTRLHNFVEVSPEIFEEQLRQRFIEGLTSETRKKYLITNDTNIKDYIKNLEELEDQLLDDIRKEAAYRSKKPAQHSTLPHNAGGTQKIWCEEHRKKGYHTTEECNLRKRKQTQAKK